MLFYFIYVKIIVRGNVDVYKYV